MSVQEQIDRISGAKTTLVDNLNTMGVAAAGSVPLEQLAASVLDIRTGVDTSDATALASEIKQSRTAYARGVKITGTCPVAASIEYASGVTCQKVSSSIQMSGKLASQKIVPTSTTINMDVPASNFGDAAEWDVKTGKTFTSASGLKLTGTHVCLGKGQCNVNVFSSYTGSDTPTMSFKVFNESSKTWNKTSMKLSDGSSVVSLIGEMINSFSTDTYDVLLDGDVTKVTMEGDYVINESFVTIWVNPK